MRCHICDAAISDPQYNRDHDDWDPCMACQEVINDTLNSYKDQALFADEEPLSIAQISP